jgi:hypothetical protein
VAQGLANAHATARRNWYGYFGTPTALFDGGSAYAGDANVEAEYRARLQARLDVGAPLSVDADAALARAGAVVSVRATVTQAPGETVPSPAECLVRVALFEEDVVHCCDSEGGNVFPHVGRFLTDGVVLDLSAGGAQTFAEEIPLDPAWSTANLRAVAFVQRGTDREVLNASPAAALEPSAVDTTSWGRIKALHR